MADLKDGESAQFLLCPWTRGAPWAATRSATSYQRALPPVGLARLGTRWRLFDLRSLSSLVRRNHSGAEAQFAAPSPGKFVGAVRGPAARRVV